MRTLNLGFLLNYLSNGVLCFIVILRYIAILIPMRYKSLGFREQGAGSREQGRVNHP